MKAIKKVKLNLPKIDLKKIKVRKDFVMGILCYLNILALIPYFFGRKDYFVEYHSKQGLAMLIVWSLAVFSFFFPVLPYLFTILIVYLMLSGFINIALGKEKPLPIIGRWAENLDI